MNPKIVKLNKIQVVIGLEWELLDSGMSERKAVREILKKNHGVKSGVLVRSADVAVLGMQAVGQKRPSAPSGAALLALANQDAQANVTGQSSSIEDNQWIVIERLGEDEYWVVDIKDGVPLPGSDFVGSYEKVGLYLSEMIEGTGFKIFTADPDIQSMVGQQAITIPRSATDIIESLEKPSRGLLKTVSGVDPAIVLVLVGFVVLVAAFFGWGYYKRISQEHAMQAAAAARSSEQAQKLAADKKGYTDAVRKAVDDALEKGVASVNSALKTPSPRDAVGSWLNIIEKIPLNHSGWSTTQVECAMETPEKPICTVHMKRSADGIDRVLLTDYPSAQIVGNEASYVVRGPDLEDRPAEWNLLANANGLVMGLISDLQFMRNANISYIQSASKDITQAITMPTPPASVFKAADASASIPPPPVNTGIAKGQLGLSGKNLWQLKGLLNLMDQGGVSAISMNVDVSKMDSQSWQMQSDYFIRSLPAPILPIIMGPDGPITVELPARFRSLASAVPVQGGVSASEGHALSSPATGSSVSPAPPIQSQGPISLGLPENPNAAKNPFNP